MANAEPDYSDRTPRKVPLELTPEELEGCQHADSKLALAITPYFFNLIDVGKSGMSNP